MLCICGRLRGFGTHSSRNICGRSTGIFTSCPNQTPPILRLPTPTPTPITIIISITAAAAGWIGIGIGIGIGMGMGMALLLIRSFRTLQRRISSPSSLFAETFSSFAHAAAVACAAEHVTMRRRVEIVIYHGWMFFHVIGLWSVILMKVQHLS